MSSVPDGCCTIALTDDAAAAVRLAFPPIAAKSANTALSRAVADAFASWLVVSMVVVFASGCSKMPKPIAAAPAPPEPPIAVVLPVLAARRMTLMRSATTSYWLPWPAPAGLSARLIDAVMTKSNVVGTTGAMYRSTAASGSLRWSTTSTVGLRPGPGSTVTCADVRRARSCSAAHPGASIRTSYTSALRRWSAPTSESTAGEAARWCYDRA
jgi:hypothetical protein